MVTSIAFSSPKCETYSIVHLSSGGRDCDEWGTHLSIFPMIQLSSIFFRANHIMIFRKYEILPRKMITFKT